MVDHIGIAYVINPIVKTAFILLHSFSQYKIVNYSLQLLYCFITTTVPSYICLALRGFDLGKSANVQQTVVYLCDERQRGNVPFLDPDGKEL